MSGAVATARRVHDLSISELIELAHDCWDKGELFNAAHFLRTAAGRLEQHGRENRALDDLIFRVTKP